MLVYRHDPALHPRSVAGVGRLNGGAGAAQFARLGAAGRPPRLHALLGGRASQSAGDRQLRARDHDRADRGGDGKHPRRLRRRHAAQPRAADGGRALQGAGGALSRAHRSRHRPRARHRSGHLLHAAAAPGHQRGGRFPRALPGIDAAGDARFSGGPPVRQGARPAGGGAAAADLSARLVGLFGAARRPDRRGVCLRASLRDFRRGGGDEALPRQFPPFGERAQSPTRSWRRMSCAPTPTPRPSGWPPRSS